MRSKKALQQEALESCTHRGHQMTPFVKGSNKRISFALCRDCGKGVYVDTQPMPNEIEVHGEAVATNCTGGR